MSTGPWRTSWCPACGAVTVYGTVGTRPWEDPAPGPTEGYLGCPRCETVTVSLPAAALAWADASLPVIAQRTWSQRQLTTVLGALGQARSDLARRPARSQQVVAQAAPYLAPVLAEAHSRDQLEDCLAGLSMVMNILVAGRSAKPAGQTMRSVVHELQDTIGSLMQGPEAPAAPDAQSA